MDGDLDLSHLHPAAQKIARLPAEERLQYAEGWYAEQKPDAEDIRMGGWVLQRRCPHLKADLTRFGKIDSCKERFVAGSAEILQTRPLVPKSA